MTIPYEHRDTVQELYKLFSHEEYKPYAYYCIESEFKPSYDVQINSFEEPVKQEPKEFILTTLKQVGAA